MNAGDADRPAPQSVRIAHADLAAMVVNDRRQLRDLRASQHIHGTLLIELGGRPVPYLGYWGPDDVCFDEWLQQLRQAAEAMSVDGSRHVFDEGEQGQPAFVFEREGPLGYFSIAASGLSDGFADPEWERIPFLASEFVAACAALRAAFRDEVLREAPTAGAEWLSRNAPDLRDEAIR